jgi:hypothetical protein
VSVVASSPRGHLHLIKAKQVKREPEWVPPLKEVATQIALRSNVDPEDFLGQRMAMRVSFEEVPPASLEFALVWSRAEVVKVERRWEQERTGVEVERQRH